jgi:dienelactone hydrolase
VGVLSAPGSGEDLLVYYPAASAAPPIARPAADRSRPAEHIVRRFGAPAASALAAADFAVPDAAPAEQPRPAVIFSPGASFGACDYRLLLQELASRGYVVVGLHPLSSPRASRERYVEAPREFLTAVARLSEMNRQGPLAGRIDIAKLAFVGHSLGGAAAILALQNTPSVRVAVNLDGDFGPGQTGAAAPGGKVLYLLGAGDPSQARRLSDWRKVTRGSAVAIALQAASLGHLDFLDAALLPRSQLARPGGQGFGPIGGQRARQTVAALLTGFLDERLAGTPGAFQRARAEAPEFQPPTSPEQTRTTGGGRGDRAETKPGIRL